ncbi:MAG: hypothetical protein E7220_08800 [Clostridiales bacterium]|nr:hypothetical protein [Clostridiales bacterium]
MDAKKIMKKLSGLSTGLAVTVAFFNVALLLTELVKTVTDDGSELGTEDAYGIEGESLELEEKY